MALTEHYYTKFLEGHFYHIYNRSVDRKPMFKNADNYQYFLRQYEHYLSEVIETYAYCLLGNYFHLLVRIPEDLTIFPKVVKSKYSRRTHPHPAKYLSTTSTRCSNSTTSPFVAASSVNSMQSNSCQVWSMELSHGCTCKSFKSQL